MDDQPACETSLKTAASKRLQVFSRDSDNNDNGKIPKKDGHETIWM
jgi:hypothetical protein